MCAGKKFIASLDVGTTTVRCFIFDNEGKSRGLCKTNVKVYFPENGHVEIHPNELWEACVAVIKGAINDSGIPVKSIVGLGISCQRNSIITWKKSDQTPYHNIITWKDIRADDIVDELNGSAKLKVFNFVCKILYTFTRSKRFLAGSILKITNAQVVPRLKWVLRNVPAILEDLKSNNVAFGTVDTWLLNKLTDGLLHVSDISCASATGLFDPFNLCWADWAFRLFKLPKEIFPEVVDSAGYHFGCLSENILGEPINIYSCMADQSSSMFGSLCFKPGEIKVTMGTGTFLNINTGNKPHASFYGIYPLVGWKYGPEIVYMAEGASNDTAILIQFAQELDLINDPSDCTQVALSVDDNSTFFAPAFNGLQAPINDSKAAAGFIGLKSTTTKAQLLRAILESIVFRLFQIYLTLKNETNFSPSSIKVDGGVSNCDFLVQMFSDIITLPVIRPHFTEVSALGTGFLAGIVAGVWKSKEELLNLNMDSHEFVPRMSNTYREKYKLWLKAIQRFFNWYS